MTHNEEEKRLPVSEVKADVEGNVETSVVKRKSLSDGSASRARQESHDDARRIIRRGLIAIGFFFGVLGIWAVFGEISGSVVAQGTVKIETERKTVQHLEGGIVESILVREGEEVIEGQPLIILESVQVDASVEAQRKQLVAQLAAQTRLTAEKDLQETMTWPEDLPQLAREAQAEDVLYNEEKLFIARRDALVGQISMLKAQIAQINAQISGFNEEERAERTIIGTLEEELKAKRQLFEQRFVEKSQILELERSLATHKGNRGRLRQSIAEARQRRTETELRIADARNRFVEDAASKLGTLENDILQTRERLRPLSDAKVRLQVTAPVTGKVVGLKIHSRGGVIRAGEPILDIVPADNPLIVELKIPVNKITEVYNGQPTQVQLDAFDARTTPRLDGKVVHVSADRMDGTNNEPPYYLCFVEIDPASLESSNLYLSPGMPATVYIMTRERTILYYMLEPLIKNWDRALTD